MLARHVSHLLVERLAPRVHRTPYGWNMDVDLGTILQHTPWLCYVGEDARERRSETWHYRRIRFFYDQLKKHKALTPITVDNYTHRGRIYPTPALLDGYHRLTAHVLAKKPTVRTRYSGRVDLLEYLTGKTDRIPEE